jgi:hypothetical protein
MAVILNIRTPKLSRGVLGVAYKLVFGIAAGTADGVIRCSE